MKVVLIIIELNQDNIPMPIVKTSPKGQVVVPAQLREIIGLRPGDLVLVSHAGGRRVLIEPVAEDPLL